MGLALLIRTLSGVRTMQRLPGILPVRKPASTRYTSGILWLRAERMRHRFRLRAKEQRTPNTLIRQLLVAVGIL